MKHEAAHGQIDERLGDLRPAFVVAAQTARATQPAEGAFDYPYRDIRARLGQLRLVRPVSADLPPNEQSPPRTSAQYPIALPTTKGAYEEVRSDTD